MLQKIWCGYKINELHYIDYLHSS